MIEFLCTIGAALLISALFVPVILHLNAENRRHTLCSNLERQQLAQELSRLRARSHDQQLLREHRGRDFINAVNTRMNTDANKAPSWQR